MNRRTIGAWKTLCAAASIILTVASTARAADVDVCFTPLQDCAPRIIAALDSAKRSLLVEEYELTSPELAAAVVAAYRRGVKVRVILDPGMRTARYSQVRRLADAGVPLAFDDAVSDKDGIAHSKVAVIDGELVIGGSYNWSKSAETRNVENVLFVRDRFTAARFVEAFERRAALTQR